MASGHPASSFLHSNPTCLYGHLAHFVYHFHQAFDFEFDPHHEATLDTKHAQATAHHSHNMRWAVGSCVTTQPTILGNGLSYNFFLRSGLVSLCICAICD